MYRLKFQSALHHKHGLLKIRQGLPDFTGLMHGCVVVCFEQLLYDTFLDELFWSYAFISSCTPLLYCSLFFSSVNNDLLEKIIVMPTDCVDEAFAGIFAKIKAYEQQTTR